ncbi:unnamed protein product, partial [Prunus brigantina]
MKTGRSHRKAQIDGGNEVCRMEREWLASWVLGLLQAGMVSQQQREIKRGGGCWVRGWKAVVMGEGALGG